MPLEEQISSCKLTTLSPLFPSCPSFTCAIKMLASGSQLCFLASPISILQSNSSGTGNLFTSHSFNCLIICSSVMIKSSNVLLSPQPSPAWKKSIQSVLLRCGLFCCYFVNPNYSFSSEVFCEMIREVHGPFQSHVGSVSSVELSVVPWEYTGVALRLALWLQPLKMQGC